MVRGLALRSLTGLRLLSVLEYVISPLKASLVDTSGACVRACVPARAPACWCSVWTSLAVHLLAPRASAAALSPAVHTARARSCPARHRRGVRPLLASRARVAPRAVRVGLALLAWPASAAQPCWQRGWLRIVVMSAVVRVGWLLLSPAPRCSAAAGSRGERPNQAAAHSFLAGVLARSLAHSRRGSTLACTLASQPSTRTLWQRGAIDGSHASWQGDAIDGADARWQGDAIDGDHARWQRHASQHSSAPDLSHARTHARSLARSCDRGLPFWATHAVAKRARTRVGTRPRQTLRGGMRRGPAYTADSLRICPRARSLIH